MYHKINKYPDVTALKEIYIELIIPLPVNANVQWIDVHSRKKGWHDTVRPVIYEYEESWYVCSLSRGIIKNIAVYHDSNEMRVCIWLAINVFIFLWITYVLEVWEEMVWIRWYIKKYTSTFSDQHIGRDVSTTYEFTYIYWKSASFTYTSSIQTTCRYRW